VKYEIDYAGVSASGIRLLNPEMKAFFINAEIKLCLPNAAYLNSLQWPSTPWRDADHAAFKAASDHWDAMYQRYVESDKADVEFARWEHGQHG
jgi:hypothetical protein